MEETLNKENPVVRLRAFRAIDDPEACHLFLQGHEHVLTSIGITKVTSSRHDWVNNPAAFVLIVESLDKKKVFGGARVHVAGGSEPLPIEQATSILDPAILDLVWEYSQYGTGEICGLWNSREIAGFGIGSIFLTRAAVAISTQIRLNSLFALCAPYTVKMAEAVGYEIERSIGNQGTFYYPKLDLLATTMLLKDVLTLDKADIDDKDAILKIRENKNIVRVEELRKRQITIHYETEIPNLDLWDFEATIANAKKRSIEKVSVSQINIL